MSRSSSNDRPQIACEVLAGRVIAGRAAPGGAALEVISSRTLPAGSVTPSLTSPNLSHPDAVRAAIADVLSAVGGSSRDVIAILPDAAVRIVLLEFDTLPEKRQEADGVVRFRLKKSLPFDVEHAAVSYDARRDNGVVRVVAAVSANSVLQEYEAAFRDAGFSPGVVLPSMLAALGNADSHEPTLVIKVAADTTSLAILARQQLLLFRSLENPKGQTPEAERLADDIYPSLVFFQDNYGMQVERVLVGGEVSSETLGAALQAQTGARVDDLVAASLAGRGVGVPTSLLAGVVGALTG